MENTKAKKIITGVLIVLLLACLGVVVWQYISLNGTNNVVVKNDATNNTQLEQQQQGTNNNQENTDKSDDLQAGTNKEENKFDPYANYKGYKWASTTIKLKSGNGSVKIKEDKNVYVTYINKENKITGISGTPIKVISRVGGTECIYILTDECKLYSCEAWDTEATLVGDLAKYNIIDIVESDVGGVVKRNIYYLTADGKLIDSNGDTFEEINKNFVYRFGNKFLGVYIDEDNYIYYSKKDDANYAVVKDTAGKKVKAKQLYMQYDSIIIILTTDNQLIYVDENYKTSQEKGKIKSINTYAEEYDAIMIAEMDTNKNIIKYNVHDYYYDVTNKVEKEIKQGKAIQSIHMYKRKNDSSYYKNVMVLTNDQTTQFKSVLSQLKQTGGDFPETEKDIYKVVIKYASGIESILKVYTGSRASYDGILNYFEDQTLEICSSLEYKFEWEKLSQISNEVKNQVTQSYDGKVVSGNEVIAACKMYNNSNDVSVKVIVDKDKQYQVGKYDVKINETVFKTLNRTINGGINVEPTGDNKYEEIKQNSLKDIENLSQSMRTQTYYSYVMKDTLTQEIVGVAFVRRGAIN